MAEGRALFAAVLELAIEDLTSGKAADREASVRLLSARRGPYARHRDLLAASAGLDPAAFYERVAPLAEAARGG